ncbi:MAG: phosphoenolpyruvate--protein phosphotransferase [Planctomycetales bacterium]|nr:phosphoenolpyruvate--protein phosphotransferase [Planctomycetales bacterium]
MQTFRGIAVSPGVAIGEAFVLDQEGFRIPNRFVDRDAVEDELDRFRHSVEAVSAALNRNRQEVAEQLGEQYGAIFSAQLQMLCDPQLQNEIETHIRSRHYSPEYAVSRTLRRYAKVFQNLENKYMAERAHDVVDIERRLLQELLGRQREELSHLKSPVIVLAHNLTPSETANLDRNFVLGFVSELGGPGGHTAIVAEALELPAIVGTGPILSDVSGGDTLIVDGENGLVILDPDEETIQKYRQQAASRKTQRAEWQSLRELPAVTLDGTELEIKANIEFPREVEACLDRRAAGIGLYRTEFLYLGTEEDPTEEDHLNAYTDVIKAMDGRPVVIRTLDLGADKMGRGQSNQDEKNPFLGLRSIRLSLRNLPLFRTQLRAILRASVLGDVSLMFPLISTIQELRQAKLYLADIMEDLEEEGIPFDRDVKIGMMVEVPAVVLMMDRFVKEVDFISIGTNDLIQYSLAVDRSNRDVANLYDASHPAVIRMIKMTVDAAIKEGVPATLCGQMSANPIYTSLLLGLGLRSFSIPPGAIPEVKNACRLTEIGHCNEIAMKVLEMDNGQQVSDFLRLEYARLRNLTEQEEGNVSG